MSKLTEISRYQLLRRLAIGGMGEVYLARQRSAVQGFSRLVVVKLLMRNYCDNAQFVQMFLDEARLAAKLHHKNIVQVFDVDTHAGQFFIVMEYIPGQNLRELLGDITIPSRSLFSPRLGAEVFADVASALATAHSDGLIHRDVSPNNIMVADTGVAKLIDFGIARATAQASLTTPGTLKGKFGYMAPEYVRGTGYDHRADLFSLGVVMWETFTRRRLFRGTSAAEQLHQLLDAEIPTLDSVVPDFPQGLSELVAQMLQRDPAGRPPTAEVVASELGALVQTLPLGEDASLAAWVNRNLHARIEHRRAADTALMALPPDADIPAFDEGTINSGSVPGTYGMVPSPSSSPGVVIPAPRRSVNLRAVTAPPPLDAPAESPVAPAPRSRSSRPVGILIAAIAAATAITVVALLTRDRSPAAERTARSAEAIERRGEEGLANAHRKIGLDAMKRRDYARARAAFQEAIALDGASDGLDDLHDLLKLVDELERTAERRGSSAPPPPPTAPPAKVVADRVVEPAEVARPSAPASKVRTPIVRRDTERRRESAKKEKVAATTEAASELPAVVEPPAPTTGDIVVGSTPSRLPVKVDGRSMGTTPARLTLPLGTHEVAILQGDRVLKTETVQLSADNLEQLVFVEAPAPAIVSTPVPTPAPAVATQPRAAAPVVVELPGDLEVLSPNVLGEVYVNGVARGPAPIVVKGLPVGRARVEIRVDGATRRTKVAEVKSGKRGVVRFD